MSQQLYCVIRMFEMDCANISYSSNKEFPTSLRVYYNKSLFKTHLIGNYSKKVF